MVFICYLLKIAIDGIYLLSTEDNNEWYQKIAMNGICFLTIRVSFEGKAAKIFTVAFPEAYIFQHSNGLSSSHQTGTSCRY